MFKVYLFKACVVWLVLPAPMTTNLPVNETQTENKYYILFALSHPHKIYLLINVNEQYWQIYSIWALGVSAFCIWGEIQPNGMCLRVSDDLLVYMGEATVHHVVCISFHVMCQQE